jgi:hypothetical protein
MRRNDGSVWILKRLEVSEFNESFVQNRLSVIVFCLFLSSIASLLPEVPEIAIVIGATIYRSFLVFYKLTGRRFATHRRIFTYFGLAPETHAFKIIEFFGWT